MVEQTGRHDLSRVAVLVLAAVALSPERAEACFCAPACAPKADATFFEATVTAIAVTTGSSLNGAPVVSVSDVVVLSGPTPRALVATASSCDYPFRVGVRYRIDGEALRTSNGRVVWASQFGATRPLWTWDLRALPTMLDWWWSGGGCRA